MAKTNKQKKIREENNASVFQEVKQKDVWLL